MGAYVLSISPGNFIIGSTGDATLDGDFYSTGNITCDGTLTMNGSLLLVKNFNGSGTFTAASGGTTKIAEDFTPGTFVHNNGGVEIYWTNASQVKSGLTFYDLTIDKSAEANTVTLSGGITVTNSLTLTKGTLSCGASTHRAAGNWDSSSTDFTLTAGGSTIELTSTNPTITIEEGVDVFNNLTLDDGATLANAVELNGNLTISAGTFATADNDIDISGNWDHNGGTFNSGTATVNFNNTGGQSLDTGGASYTFDDLQKSGSGTLTISGGDIDVDGTLTIGGGCTVDMTDENFTIATLDNNGTLGLAGSQTTQQITTMDTDSGSVEYNGTAGGTVNITPANQFYNLAINSAGQTFNQPSADITVFNDLLLLAGTLNAANAPYKITVGRNFDSSSGGSFTCNTGEVVFDSAGTSQISEDNAFYDLTCTIAGKVIRFRGGDTQTILAGGTLQITGTSGNEIELNRATPPVDYWYFNLAVGANLDIQYVDVYWSYATPQVVVIPPDVSVTSCVNWVDVMEVNDSDTIDLDGNGKIDRIEAFLPAAHNGDYSTISASVAGYSVIGYEDGSVATSFYVLLNEGSCLDTDAQPVWEIVSNSNLVDLASGTKAVYTSAPLTPDDMAAPTIGYTLSKADDYEIFVHFSEFVEKSGGGVIDASDFSYDGTASVTGLSRIITSGTDIKEAILTLDGNVSADEILALTNINTSADLQDLAAASNTLASGATHRVSDVGLGLTGNGVMEPVWAVDETQMDSGRGGDRAHPKF